MSVCWLLGQMRGAPTGSADEANAPFPRQVSSFLALCVLSCGWPASARRSRRKKSLPLLAHNVFAQGYEGSRDGGRPTEFLILLSRYVHQARELAALAGPDGSIHVSNCDEAKPLLHILGYRVRQDCGKSNTSLVTADPERAFVTIDSGFPLPELEETLQGGKPFTYAFPASRVPVLFTESDWTAIKQGQQKCPRDLIETLLRDPVLCSSLLGIGSKRCRNQSGLAAIRGARETASVRRRPGFLRKSHLHSLRTRDRAGRSGCGLCLEGSGRGEPGFATRVCCPVAGQG